MVFATLCGLEDLEYGLGNLEVWSTFSLSQASYFTDVVPCLDLYMLYVNPKNSTTNISIRQQTTRLGMKFWVL